MSEENASGNTDLNPEGQTGVEDKVAYSTHKKLLGERKRDLEKMRSLEERLNVFETAKKDGEQKDLEAKGEYQKIIDLRGQENEKLQNDNVTLAGELHKTWKRQAFYNKLDGSLLSTDYETHIDFNSIAINPETHQVDAESVDVAVNSFLEKHPHLVKRNNAKVLPGKAPQNFAPKPIGSMNSTEKSDQLKSALTTLLTTTGR